GPGGNQAIGPNETLVFDVELIAVNPGQDDAGSDE
ncbi:MAG: FKBP-type peptidyl-prolyl cis-trans isomerase, partial [Pseudomonadota bacterium]|nr:FKBP-type peptidyl-prolyl cis-trans isomerase [Pseudomonadota bacterium]